MGYACRPRWVRVFGGASRASAAEGGGALWRTRPKAASPQRALRYRKVLRACSKSERVAYFCALWRRRFVLFSPCLDGRARRPVPRRLSRERFRPRLGTITHRQAGQTGGRQATQQVWCPRGVRAFPLVVRVCHSDGVIVRSGSRLASPLKQRSTCLRW